MRSSPSNAYERLLYRCSEEEWDVGLARGKRGWELSIREGGELIARTRSTLDVPECYERLAIAASVALAKRDVA